MDCKIRGAEPIGSFFGIPFISYSEDTDSFLTNDRLEISRRWCLAF